MVLHILCAVACVLCRHVSVNEGSLNWLKHNSKSSKSVVQLILMMKIATKKATVQIWRHSQCGVLPLLGAIVPFLLVCMGILHGFSCVASPTQKTGGHLICILHKLFEAGAVVDSRATDFAFLLPKHSSKRFTSLCMRYVFRTSQPSGHCIIVASPL